MSTERLFLQEQRGQLEQLIGRPISEVVCSLPTLPLFTRLELCDTQPEIIFKPVKYPLERYEYRLEGSSLVELDRPDIPLPPVKALQGEKIDPEKLVIHFQPGYAVGLTSRVHFTPKGQPSQIEAQMPMMDFDFDPNGIDEYGALWLIKKELREMAEMSGLILKSSIKPGHFHFLGDRVLSNEQFLTFLGVSLLMQDKEGRFLADPKFIGHALTARMRDFVDFRNYSADRFFSIYDRTDGVYPYPDVFTTLCIKSGELGWVEPTVIDVL